MAGHSKWANTKHRKKAQDIKRSKIFTKIIREITNASTKNGSNLNTNFQLRTILEKANNYNIRKDLIEKAIQRGLGHNQKNIFKTVKYAGYSSNGIAIIIHCTTNNSNRTVNSIRNIFSRFNGNLVKYENIQYLFDFFNVIKIDNRIYSDRCIMDRIGSVKLLYLKEKKKNFLELTIRKNNFKLVKQKLLSANIIFQTMNIIIKPNVLHKLDAVNKKNIIELINLLQNLQETTEVIHNAQI